MARDHARIDVHIWSNDEFCRLPAMAKIVYLQLISQPKLSYAGVLDLAAKRWARPHPDLDTAGVKDALVELDAARFVVVDQDTEELLVRTFIRNDELYKQPNVLAAALRVAFDIESPILRSALAVELRLLPADVTGPAPAVAADALEAGDPKMPASVKAALAVRRSGRPPASPRPRPTPQQANAEAGDTPDASALVDASTNPSPTPSQNPSVKPSRKDRGEGSRERETGEPSLTSRSEKVGVPAPTRAHTREASRSAGNAAAADLEVEGNGSVGSVRQQRRADAERLVDFYGSEVPGRVRVQLVAEVITMLREGISSAVIAAGLQAWSAKTLPPRFLSELVGERMRADRVAGADSAKRARDIDIAEQFENLRACAIAEDDQHGLGPLLRQARPQHADADQLTAILDQALERSEVVAA